jgi:urease accessory protein
MLSNNQGALDGTPSGWQATLNLGFASTSDRTVLVKRDHTGPLTVQRPFYPEGKICHVYILHPPGGIVGGDHLTIFAKAAPHSHGLITTPAAGKFYRSAGEQAIQNVDISVAEHATVEWLPQESIIYEGAQVKSSVKVDIAANARFIGWEIMSLGRPASGEGFEYGRVELSWQISCQNQPLLIERLCLDAMAFSACWGLQSFSACGTLFAIPANKESLTKVQELIGETKGRGVTLIDNLLICRALDSRTDRLRGFFEQVWESVRPDTAQNIACKPRIWAT